MVEIFSRIREIEMVLEVMTPIARISMQIHVVRPGTARTRYWHVERSPLAEAEKNLEHGFNH